MGSTHRQTISEIPNQDGTTTPSEELLVLAPGEAAPPNDQWCQDPDHEGDSLLVRGVWPWGTQPAHYIVPGEAGSTVLLTRRWRDDLDDPSAGLKA